MLLRNTAPPVLRIEPVRTVSTKGGCHFRKEDGMANIRKSLETVEDLYGEPIEAIVVGQHDNSRYESKPSADENVILSREAGLTKLDYEYDNGYGGTDCHPFYAWSASRVFFMGEYDGATWLNWAPRNPMALEPSFSGNDMFGDMLEKNRASQGSVTESPETAASSPA